MDAIDSTSTTTPNVVTMTRTESSMALAHVWALGANNAALDAAVAATTRGWRGPLLR